MKHALITGGAGFIGSHLADALLARGDRVTVVDDESTGNPLNLKHAIGQPGFSYLQASIAEPGAWSELLAEVDEVYHLAAAVGVQLIAQDAVRTIETNIQPTALLIDLALARHRAGGRLKVFLASTSEVYGKNPKPTWTEEDDLVLGSTTRPRWAYGASKAIDEFLALGAHRQVGLPVVVGRFFNVVGPRQTGRYGMVLPRMVDAALNGGPVVVHDDGNQVRCFAHVSDVVRAVLELMGTPMAVGRVFNIGSDRPVRILDLARRVVRQVDPNLEICFQSYAEAYPADFEDVRSRVPDLTRLRETIDYRPQFELDQIIAQVIAHQSAGANS